MPTWQADHVPRSQATSASKRGKARESAWHPRVTLRSAGARPFGQRAHHARYWPRLELVGWRHRNALIEPARRTARTRTRVRIVDVHTQHEGVTRAMAPPRLSSAAQTNRGAAAAFSSSLRSSINIRLNYCCDGQIKSSAPAQTVKDECTKR